MTLLGLNIDLRQLHRVATLIHCRKGNVASRFVADAAQLPIADESIDAAMAIESVFHFDRPRFFAEIGRVRHHTSKQ
jgi:hypothetical protein